MFEYNWCEERCRPSTPPSPSIKLHFSVDGCHRNGKSPFLTPVEFCSGLSHLWWLNQIDAISILAEVGGWRLFQRWWSSSLIVVGVTNRKIRNLENIEEKDKNAEI
jgi:hypothetical protein